MKQRFNYLDIRAIVNELRPLILNTYIQNIYSPSNKHYIFKLSSKHLILVEPGARIHLTNTYENVQTHFNIIARKYLRRNIIKEISQIGFDRVICIVTNKYKIYFEFFAGGNIVITDFDQVIVDLWRTVKEVNVEKGEIYVTNEVVLDYSMEMMYKLGFKDMIGLVRQINEDVRKRVDRKIREIGYCINKEENGICKTNKVEERTDENDVDIENNKSDASGDKNSKEKSSASFANSNCTLSLDECMNNEKLVSVYNQFMNDVIQSFKDTANIGTLIYVKGKPNTFMPYKIDKIDYLPSLNEALMVYYKKEEKVVKSKSNIVKDKQEKRIKDLDDEIALCDTKVSIMYENQDKVEHILQAHKSVIEYNLDWKEFEKFKNDQEDLKQLIENSDFKNKTVALKIEDVKIVCNFMENFNTNINRIYDLKRKIKEKSEKTSKNIKKVVKSVEKKENKVAKKKVKIDRKTYWFEKFNYFIYQNKLIIGGKTAQQNDIIVKKYFTPKDLYFHADIHGASSVILKNGIDNNEDVLTVTGLVALCNSNCWKNKVTSDVYYVNHDQVSKTAESGEYLSTGSFIIRGKKNYLDVFRLEYGIGIIFKKKRKNIDLDDLAIKEEDIHLSFVIDPGMEEIEHALIICGPWVVMKTYKYKEKLLPGVEKKGKLVTEVMKRFCNKLKECENESEVNAMKNISHDEYMAVIINNSKIGKQ